MSEEEVRNPTVWLREIAVQLAEQNNLTREIMARRKADDESMKSFREQSLKTASDMKQIMQPLAAPPAVPRLVVARDGPQHIGCLLLMADGSVAIDCGGPELVPFHLDPLESGRILALLKPPEGKPQ